MTSKFDSINKLKGVLIVSCQADVGEPLCKPEIIAALSLSVLSGGASALRLEGVENVRAVRAVTDVPIIGLTKIHGITYDERMSSAFITSTFAEAKALSDAGADIIAIDATGRPRKDGLSVGETIKRIHDELNKPVMADLATIKEAEAACKVGADILSTTLFGYTEETLAGDDVGPGFDLLSAMLKVTDTPVIMEGRIWHPQEVTKAFELGAYAVVVGSAITRPHHITKRFLRAIPESSKTQEKSRQSK
jgi:N-acylglucosamine-6-phosphate 2-epimerase